MQPTPCALVREAEGKGTRAEEKVLREGGVKVGQRKT